MCFVKPPSPDFDVDMVDFSGCLIGMYDLSHRYSAHFDGGQFPDYLKLQYVSSIPLTTEHSQEFTSNLVILGRCTIRRGTYRGHAPIIIRPETRSTLGVLLLPPSLFLARHG